MAIERPAVAQDGHIRLVVYPDIAMLQIAMDKGGLELPASRLHWAEKARNDLFHDLLAELLQFVMRPLDPKLPLHGRHHEPCKVLLLGVAPVFLVGMTP